MEYQGEHFYFQPNGNTCYLYRRREDVGNIHLRAWSPKKKSIRLVTQQPKNNNNKQDTNKIEFRREESPRVLFPANPPQPVVYNNNTKVAPPAVPNATPPSKPQAVLNNNKKEMPQNKAPFLFNAQSPPQTVASNENKKEEVNLLGLPQGSPLFFPVYQQQQVDHNTKKKEPEGKADSPQEEGLPFLDPSEPQTVVRRIDWHQEERKRIFNRTGGRCYLCNHLLNFHNRHYGLEGAWHVEHIVPLSKSGPDTLGNLLPACASCNLKKGRNR